MKNPSSGEPSPFSSSTHDPKLAGQPAQNQPAPSQNQPAPASPNVPDSVREVMAQNARASSGGGVAVLASSYKASGKVGPNAFLPMLLAALSGAIATGAIYYLLAPHFNAVLVTQFYLGALVGGAVWLGAKAGKVRSSRYSSVFAVLGAILVFGIYHGANVWREREEILDFYAPSVAKSTGMGVAATRVQLGQKLSYARATQLYWKSRFQNGVTLRETKSSRSSTANATSTGTHIAGWGYVAFLLAEVGFTALIAAGIASTATTARFSETQGRWYSKKRAFSLGDKEVVPVLQLLRAGDWAGAQHTATERKWKVADVAQVYVATVPGEEGGWVEMTMTQDKQQKLLFEAQVDGDAIRALMAKT